MHGEQVLPEPSAPPARTGWPLALRNAGSLSPLLIVPGALLALPWIEVDPWFFAVTVAVIWVVGLGVTAGFHRGFAHHAYKTSRPVAFLSGVVGCMALQKGPLWWVAVHRLHHKHSDTELDPHSPTRRGLWYAFAGWMFSRNILLVDRTIVKDLAKYPELVWLDRLWMVPGMLFAAGLYWALGWGGVVIGYCLPVTFMYAVTFAVNSVGHMYGPQRFETGDRSRNNILMGILGMGDGWHNNHHRVPYSARHGFRWYELDSAYQVIRILAWLGLVWDVKLPPKELMAGHDPRAAARGSAEPNILPPDEEPPSSAAA